MSEPRELLEAYSDEEAYWNGTSGFILNREDAAPKAFDALRAVLDMCDGPSRVRTAGEIRRAITEQLGGQADREPPDETPYTEHLARTLLETVASHMAFGDGPRPEPPSDTQALREWLIDASRVIVVALGPLARAIKASPDAPSTWGGTYAEWLVASLRSIANEVTATAHDWAGIS